jgi:hypothetical protein
MAEAINLDDQSSSRAIKIDNVPVERVLLAKLEPPRPL